MSWPEGFKLLAQICFAVVACLWVLCVFGDAQGRKR